MKTAVVYARYSSDNQTEQSIEGQLRVCEEFAKRNEILILDTYIDRAMTGTNDNRPAFQQMIKDSSKKEWNYVLVYKLDRFSRNKYESVIHKKTLKSNNVKVLSAMENIPDTPEGILMESLLEGFNQYFSEELRQKVKRGMRETRLKGYYQGGSLPYGYKLDGRKIIVDEDKRETVKYIYSKYINGYSITQIIKDLTQKGIYNKGRQFSINTIYAMLRNIVYTGIYIKDGEQYDNMFPQIIDVDTFNKAKSKQKNNKYGKTSIKNTYIFKNKLVCGYCGKPISAECGTSRLGKKLYYYKCVGIKKYHNNCVKETMKQDVLEEFLLDAIISEMEKPNIIKEIVQKLMTLQNNKTENQLLDNYIKAKRQAEIQLNNLVSAVEEGIRNKTTGQRMIELENRIEQLEKDILIERSKVNFRITEEEMYKFYKEALKQEPLMLVNTLIKEIKLYNDKVEIIFNNPTMRNPEEQGSSFLLATKKLKHIIQNRILPEYKDVQVVYIT